MRYRYSILLVLVLSCLQAASANELDFIDTLVARKLQRLNLPASPRCSDGDFIRRAHLDACGILPTAEEVENFLNGRVGDRERGGNGDGNTHGDKRARLIDSLLARDEFVDYWTYKWCDLLLVSSRKLNGKAMWSFYNFIRESVKTNKPWDVFAREILTATGSNLENGAANYFVIHKETLVLTETTTQAFLGTSIMCARCHNHPLEKWTNKEYYAFANLFARVNLKNGDTPGEVIVFPSTQGDLIHPRLGKPLPPKPLDGKPIALNDPRDRRLVLAEWMTSPNNPYFARAFVNRVWRNFMGRGLVEAEDDLRLTNPPSNAELLDALVRGFVGDARRGVPFGGSVRVGGRDATAGVPYDVRRLIRTIMLSETYQRSSEPVKGNESDNKFYSRFLVRRLPAEVMLDAISQVTGVPTDFNQFMANDRRVEAAGYPKGTRALQLADSRVISYFLDAFGRPPRDQTCSCERQQEPSVQQALHLANGDTVNQKLRVSPVIEAMVKQNLSDDEVVKRLFLSALSRYPTGNELKRILPVLANSNANAVERRQAIEDLFAAVLTDKEFLFSH